MAARPAIRSLLFKSPTSAAQLFTPKHQILRLNPLFQYQPSKRAMATATPPKMEWLVVIPDKPGTLAKRLEVRPTHFANLKDMVTSGAFRMGGAILDEPPAAADTPATELKFAGSTLVVLASTKEEVMGMIKDDVYVSAGVWDLEKVSMWPLKLAFMKEHPAP